MSRLRILQVVPSLNRAGAEYSLLFAARELASRGHDVEVCALHEPHELLPEFERAGLRVHRLHGASRQQLPHRVAQLIQVISEGEYDVIRTLMAEASMTTALTWPLAHRAIRVASFHHVDFDVYPVDRLSRRLYRATYGALMRNTVDACVGISEAVARHHERHLGVHDVQVIWNGFPVQDLQRQAASSMSVRESLCLGAAFVAVCPARLASDKGHEYLIEAAARLHREGRLLLVLLYGAGPREAELRALAGRMGLDSVVRFMGTVPQEQLMPVVAAADVLVLPSPHGEGFGRVLAEAMAVGTTVVTPGIAGALDFVEDGRTGLFVQPASADSIADALRRLMTSPGLARALGDTGRTHIERDLDIRICGDRWEALFERTLPKGGYR